MDEDLSTELPAIRRIVEYLWQDEQENFNRPDGLERRNEHIYLSLIAARRLYERLSGETLDHLD